MKGLHFGRAAAWALAGLVAVGGSAAQASVVETFTWVSVSATGGTTTPTGSLTLTLPSITTGSASGTFTATNANAAAAAAEITAFSFTYSDGATLSLSDLTSAVAPATGSISVQSPFSWATSNLVTPSGASSGYYLITGFTLSGHKTFAGTTGLGNFQIADAAGLVGNVASDAATATPASPGVAANDSGYWKLSVTAVPVPATLPLLLSAIAGLGALARRREPLIA